MKPLNIAAVLERLPGRRISYFETLSSTMTEAARLAVDGAPAGTAVIAEEQTAGQGRHGRAWYSEAGSGIYVSVILRPRVGPESLPALTMALGLGAAEAIARTTDLACDLRWPNDLMLGDRKVAGILAQFVEGAAVAGIGVNVNHAAFPPELAAEATSLRLASGGPHSRECLLAELLISVDSFVQMLSQAGHAAIIEQFARRSTYAAGKRVRVELAEGAIVGTTAGLDPCGFLKVRRDDGGETLVVTGGVRALGA
jgi:BirA family transcriptional regulator, biotin operon repressor / biotin---[acetyl-CoA-carboxylase] ligase